MEDREPHNTTSQSSSSDHATDVRPDPEGPFRPSRPLEGGVHRPAPQPPQYPRGSREGGRSDRSELARPRRPSVRSRRSGQSAGSSEALGRSELPPRWRGL